MYMYMYMYYVCTTYMCNKFLYFYNNGESILVSLLKPVDL